MVTINLLPWRQHLERYQQKKIYKLMLMLGCLNIVCFFIVHFLFSYNREKLKLKVEMYHNHNMTLDVRGYTENKQAKNIRPSNHEKLPTVKLIYLLLTYFSQLNEEGVCLTTIKSDNKQMQINGITTSLFALSQQIEYWQKLPWLSEININLLDGTAINQGFRFELNAYHRLT